MSRQHLLPKKPVINAIHYINMGNTMLFGHASFFLPARNSSYAFIVLRTDQSFPYTYPLTA